MDDMRKAKQAIDRVFNDASVPVKTTRERLEELIEYIRETLATI